MDLKTLYDEKATLVAEAKSVHANPEGEGGVLSEEQRNRDDAIEARLETLNDQINRGERQRKREMETAKAVATGDDGVPSLVHNRDRAKPSAEIQRHAFEQFVRHGYAGLTTPEIKAALTTAQDDLGGVLVPEDFHAELLKDLPGFTVVRPLARVIPTMGDFAVFPALASGTDPYASDLGTDSWKTESDLLSSVTGRTTQNKPSFERSRIPVNYWAPDHIVIGPSLLNNPVVDLFAEISRLLAETKGLDEDKAFLVGTGVNRPKGVVQEAIDGNITTVNSGASANITYDGMVNLFTGLPAQYRQNAVFVMNSASYAELLKLEDTAGSHIIRPTETPNQLWGHRIVFSEFMADPTTGGNEPIIFGDFRHYGIGDGLDMRVFRLDESYAPSVGLLVYARLGGQVLRTSAFRVMTVAA